MRRLGKTQQGVLASLKRHGSWSLNCGWLWDTPSNTQRIMDSLVRAERVTIRSNGERDVYYPIDMSTGRPSRVVILSGGHTVNGDNMIAMLKLQHRILMRLCGLHKNDALLQKLVGDANMLGLKVADRLAELQK